MKKWVGAPALGLALLGIASSPASAEGEPEFRFSGFGSVVATKVDRAGVEFVQPGQTSGAGESFTFKSDSRLGGQLDAVFNKTFSATAQVLAKHSGQGDDRPRVEWLLAKAKLNDQFALRAGRMGAPFFAVSDFREVGYANTWLRTPTDVYGQVFMRTFDGADVLYSGSIGGLPVTGQALVGGTKAVFERTDIDFKKLVGLNATVEFADGVTFRAGRVQGKLTVNSSSLRQLVSTLAATPFASVGDQINCTDRSASFSGIGLTLDRGRWVGSAEFTQRKTACYVSDTTGWYLMGGYRFGNFTPFALVSRVKVDDSNINNTIPRGVNATLNLLAGTVDRVIGTSHTEQSTRGIGVRWDAWRNIAVKGQFERVDPKGAYGMFRPTGPQSTEPVNVLSIGVDFYF